MWDIFHCLNKGLIFTVAFFLVVILQTNEHNQNITTPVWVTGSKVLNTSLKTMRALSCDRCPKWKQKCPHKSAILDFSEERWIQKVMGRVKFALLNRPLFTWESIGARILDLIFLWTKHRPKIMPKQKISQTKNFPLSLQSCHRMFFFCVSKNKAFNDWTYCIRRKGQTTQEFASIKNQWGNWDWGSI